MLEYRDFPYKTVVPYLLFAPFFSYIIFNLTKLTTGTLFPHLSVDHLLILGYGAAAGALSLVIAGLLVDHSKRAYHFMVIGAAAPVTLKFIADFLGYPNEYSPLIEIGFVLLLFSGLVYTMVSWTVLLNRTVIAKFRGRTVALFLAISLSLLLVLVVIDTSGISLYPYNLPVPEMFATFPLIGNLYFRPWKWEQHPLAIKLEYWSYFVVTAFVLAAHILWITATTYNISAGFSQAGDSTFINLAQYASLQTGINWEIYQILFLAIGVIIAGFMADLRGRKACFSFIVLAFGFLTIFGTAFYDLQSINGDLVMRLDALPLLAWERIVEGFLLGLCLMLVWTEMGSPKTKGKRLSFVWAFFLGYMALYWAVSLGAFGWSIPVQVGEFGNEFAILLSLVALYRISALPEILGREMEMEDFELGFDEDQVKETVDAFLEDHDFESIRTQLDVIEAGSEMSDKDLSAFLGDDLKEMLPLRRVKGIGEALEEKLQDAGYTSAAQLAGETPKRLASKVSGLSEKQATKLIKSARDVVQTSMTENNDS